MPSSDVPFDPKAPLKTDAYICPSKGADFELGTVMLPPMTDTMLQVELQATGLCHTDIHMRDNDWGSSDYPLVAGHEGIGRVTHLGAAVKTHKVGDTVMIGWIRDSCTHCTACLAGEENMCSTGYQGTYLGKSAGPWGKDERLYNTQGGCFARIQRIEARFAAPLPDGIPLDMACPLACAGATVWEPICNWGAIAKRVGVIGIGGLGLLAVKLAKLSGCIVVAISRTESKRETSLKAGASEFWVVGEDESDDRTKLDVIIDTRPANAPLDTALKFLSFGGALVRVGIPTAADQDFGFKWIPLIFSNQKVVGSAVCGTKNTQKMYDIVQANMDFMQVGNEGWGKAERVPISKVNEAMGKLLRGENKGYRYVLEW